MPQANNTFDSNLHPVARHLNNLSISGATPSFIQPALYPRENPPPYTEYASEVEYLSAFQMPADDLGYWDNTRGNVLELVRDRTQAGPCVRLEPPTYLTTNRLFLAHIFITNQLCYPSPPVIIQAHLHSPSFKVFIRLHLILPLLLALRRLRRPSRLLWEIQLQVRQRVFTRQNSQRSFLEIF
jgi:hypothetical protein